MTAKTTGARPSQLLGIDAEWIAYQFDSAVSTLGNVIESASYEREEVGSGTNKRWERKYTMGQLLDPEFRLPSPRGSQQRDAIAALKALQGKGVKVFKAKD